MKVKNEQNLSRRRMVAGNWKMNILPADAKGLVDSCLEGLSGEHAEILFCPPYTHLANLSGIARAGIHLGAQNCSEYASGAFTSEISAEMLINLGCTWVILGHSECRARNSYEKDRVADKIRRAIEAGLKVIYCCGEPLEIRDAGQHVHYVMQQLETDFSKMSVSAMDHVTIAYEPIWAIGTGKTASTDQAAQMHEHIRAWMKQQFPGCGEALKILYGGSVNAGNARDLAHSSSIDGVLVGGASLKPDEFKIIISAFS